jgi:2-polyprenyl-3-methyl-5-hydroxy-6-metoxy-1,4-benzoquinol methylase
MTSLIRKIFDRSRLMFQWRYFRGQTPWDTNITPPEVMEFISKTPPGRALDLGCGTGTNAVTLALKGWQVTGVDFVGKAIRAARRKSEKSGLAIDFHEADVSDLSMLTGPYDYALDIGCLFTLTEENRGRCARHLARLVKPDGMFMLYAWLPRPWQGKTWGISPEDLDTLMQPAFSISRSVIGEENSFPTGWYWFERK